MYLDKVLIQLHVPLNFPQYIFTPTKHSLFTTSHTTKNRISSNDVALPKEENMEIAKYENKFLQPLRIHIKVTP